MAIGANDYANDSVASMARALYESRDSVNFTTAAASLIEHSQPIRTAHLRCDQSNADIFLQHCAKLRPLASQPSGLSAILTALRDREAVAGLVAGATPLLSANQGARLARRRSPPCERGGAHRLEVGGALVRIDPPLEHTWAVVGAVLRDLGVEPSEEERQFLRELFARKDVPEDLFADLVERYPFLFESVLLRAGTAALQGCPDWPPELENLLSFAQRHRPLQFKLLSVTHELCRLSNHDPTILSLLERVKTYCSFSAN